ncbi:MAG TPA: SRPBCC domain-containing protein [Bellilinea sp.]|nr:SRPBCC domain-containing protein [Bellilinea sp.]
MYPAAEMELFKTTVQVPPELVYRAFIRGVGLCEWLCNGARTFPKVGGMVTLWWNSGYYTVGEFVRLEPNRTIIFTWQGRSEQHPSQVQVQITADGDQTQVGVTHSGLGSEEIWTEPRRELHKLWEQGLENLKSVLETGKDQRVVNRPGMGIYPAELSAEIKKEKKFPVDKGIYLHQVIEGRGAEKAGLKKGDLVTKLAGSPLERIETLLQVLSRQKMGTQVEVEFYRGPEKHMVFLELMPLPVPQVPETHAELIQALEESCAVEYHKLQEALANITDESADWKPAAEEWSIKEILAHLIHTERDNQVGMHTLLLDEDFEWVDNTLERGVATIAAYPSIAELMDEVARSQKETIHFLKVLPQSFLARKGSYWKVAQNLLTNDTHMEEHTEQILENLRQMAAIRNP